MTKKIVMMSIIRIESYTLPISLGIGRYAAVFCLEKQAQHNVFVHIYTYLSIIAMSYDQLFS